MELFVAVMRTQRDHSHYDLNVVNLINHAIVLVDAPRPCLGERKMPQVFDLSGAGARVLLQLYKQVGYLLHYGFVAALLDYGELGLCGLSNKNYVCHRR